MRLKNFPVKSSRRISREEDCPLAGSTAPTSAMSFPMSFEGMGNFTSSPESALPPLLVFSPECQPVFPSALSVSPARTLAAPEKERESPAPAAGFSSRPSELSELSDQLGSSLRTFLLYELAELKSSSLSWKPQVIASCHQSWWALMTLKPRTSVKESGSLQGSQMNLCFNWPTPTVMDSAGFQGKPDKGRTGPNSGRTLTGKVMDWPTPTAGCLTGAGNQGRQGGQNLQTAILDWPTPRNSPASMYAESQETFENRQTGHKGAVDSLARAAQMWPTPTVCGNNNRAGISEKAGDGLATAAKNWPTPRAEDSESAGAHRGVPDTLTSAVRNWPTPTVQDSQNNAPPSQFQRNSLPLNAVVVSSAGTGPQGLENPSTTGKNRAQLNPRWVCQLMGLPSDWCDFIPLGDETPSRD